MNTIADHERKLGTIPASVASVLGALEREAGSTEVRSGRLAEQLQTLIQVARIQSTEASNAIEGITATPARLRALVVGDTAPTNRSEAEIAGYRHVLDMIHSSHEAIPFGENIVKQFHRDLYRFTPVRHAGEYKVGDNAVTETRPDGRQAVRFEPLSQFETRLAMPQLHETFDGLWRAETYPRLLLAGAYIFDFLMIHPFQDGNGRTSRLLTLLLAYHSGHSVGRFISLERIIDDSRETYYGALLASTRGWHESRHTIWPWMEYFLGTFQAAYSELTTRLDVVTGGAGAKTRAIREFIRNRAVAEFSIEDVRRATPAGDDLIRKVIADLRRDGAIEIAQRGRYARYRRLRDDF